MGNTRQVDVRVGNMDRDHDASAIQRGLREKPGLLELQVWPRSAKLRITFDPAVGSVDAYRLTLRRLGFPAQEGRKAPEL